MPSPEPRTASPRLADRYRVLLDIGQTLAGTLTQDDLYRAIYRETAEVLEASGFYVSVYDEARDVATIVFYADRDDERRTNITYRGSDSEVIRDQRASMVHARDEGQSLMVLGADEEADVTASAISAPMRHKNRVLGAISAQSYRPDAYTEEDLELLQGIADIAGIAVENARFVSQLERRKTEAEKVEEIGRALTASLDSEEVLDRVIDAALGVVSADASTVWLLEGTVARVAASGGETALPVGTTWDLEGPFYQRLVRAREPVLIEDVERSDLVPDALREHLPGGSGLAVPMILDDEVAGALSAESRQTRFFTADDIHVLNRIASQASVALQNARLHQNVQALSLTDPLTGLPNRRHLRMHLEREVAAGLRGRDLVLVILDLDDFKEYNDTLGHLAGDDILRAFAGVLAAENRAMNLVARYGGDEFISVLSDTDLEGAAGYLERVRMKMEQEPLLATHGITVSCGTARFERDCMGSPEELVEAADADLYERKADKGPW